MLYMLLYSLSKTLQVRKESQLHILFYIHYLLSDDAFCLEVKK